jgi:hypothetical protein
MVRALVAIIAVCIFASPAMADASTMCLYGILIESHALALECEGPLASADEARYSKLRKAVRNFIIENSRLSKSPPADPEKMLSTYEASAESHHAEGKFCASQDYLMDRKLLTSLIEEKESAAILDSLNTPHDPYDGDCL